MSKLELQIKNERVSTNSIYNTIILLSVVSVLIITDSIMDSILSFNLVERRIILFAVIISLFTFIILFVNRKIKVDLIFILLSLRIPFFLIQPLIYSGFNESFFANYLIVIIAPIVYQMTIFNDGDSNTLVKNIVKYSIIIIFIQLVSVYMVSISKSVPAYMFKSSLLIPIGGSNYIAAILLILGIMSLKVFNNKHYALISFVGIFLTLSNSGIITAILTLIIFLMGRRQKVKFRSAVKLFISLFIFVGLFLIIANQLRDFTYIDSIFSRYSRMINAIFKIGNNNQVSTFDISNGRINIFSNTIIMIQQRPVLGWGLGIVENSSKVHNWLLQGLLNGGIIGLSIYLLPLLIVINKLWKSRSLDYSYFTLLIIFASLLQGLVEPNYFTPVIELLIWLFIGIALRDRQEKVKGM